MNELARLTKFFFDENYGREIRILDKDNNYWFVVADACIVLDISNSRKAIADFPENERMTVTNSYGHSGKRGGAQYLNIINEAGLYRLIFKSRKPEAKRFQTWVFEEVLPSIRKYGLYRASLPKTWSFAGEENLTWNQWIDRREKAYFRKHPGATPEDFLKTLPNR